MVGSKSLRSQVLHQKMVMHQGLNERRCNTQKNELGCSLDLTWFPLSIFTHVSDTASPLSVPGLPTLCQYVLCSDHILLICHLHLTPHTYWESYSHLQLLQTLYPFKATEVIMPPNPLGSSMTMLHVLLRLHVSVLPMLKAPGLLLT